MSYSVLILKSDRLHAHLLRQAVLTAFADAQCHTTHRCLEATEHLSIHSVDLFVTGIDSLDGNVLDLLSASRRKTPASAVLVITSRREPRILAGLCSLEVEGVFDSAVEDPAALHTALAQVRAGRKYRSASLAQQMYESTLSPKAICRILTWAEQRVLAVIGDGCDDDTAAGQLGIQPATVCTIRRSIHRKLHIRQRGELVRAAVFAGYVCLASGNIMRPGFSLLAEANRPKRGRQIEPAKGDRPVERL